MFFFWKKRGQAFANLSRPYLQGVRRQWPASGAAESALANRINDCHARLKGELLAEKKKILAYLSLVIDVVHQDIIDVVAGIRSEEKCFISVERHRNVTGRVNGAARTCSGEGRARRTGRTRKGGTRRGGNGRGEGSS